jgi:hypothetical protein
MYFPCFYTGAMQSMKSKLFLSLSLAITALVAASRSSADLPANRWVEIRKDAVGAYDSRRDQVILHGAGEKQNELWVFDLSSRMWIQKKPRVVAPAGKEPPACTREAVYIPGEDAFLIYGPAPEDLTAPAVWVYKPDENTWRLLDIPPLSDIEPARGASQNRALVYDPKRDLVLLVLGSGGDAGDTLVYAMRYRHGKARFVEAR